MRIERLVKYVFGGVACPILFYSFCLNDWNKEADRAGVTDWY